MEACVHKYVAPPPPLPPPSPAAPNKQQCCVIYSIHLHNSVITTEDSKIFMSHIIANPEYCGKVAVVDSMVYPWTLVTLPCMVTGDKVRSSPPLFKGLKLLRYTFSYSQYGLGLLRLGFGFGVFVFSAVGGVRLFFFLGRFSGLFRLRSTNSVRNLAFLGFVLRFFVPKIDHQI